MSSSVVPGSREGPGQIIPGQLGYRDHQDNRQLGYRDHQDNRQLGYRDHQDNRQLGDRDHQDNNNNGKGGQGGQVNRNLVIDNTNSIASRSNKT